MSYEPVFRRVPAIRPSSLEGVEMRSASRFCRGFAIAVALCAAGCHVPVSRATSPDGRWTVEVEYSPGFFGLFGTEVVMERKGPGGTSRGVIDMCGWTDAKMRYGTIDITNERAVVGDRVERFHRTKLAGTDHDD